MVVPLGCIRYRCVATVRNFFLIGKSQTKIEICTPYFDDKMHQTMTPYMKCRECLGIVQADILRRVLKFGECSKWFIRSLHVVI
jgi:hypothetical protein